MNVKPIITSLLEDDLYKFTMWQAMLHAYPAATGEYRFVCRNDTAFPLGELVDQVNAQLDHLCTLRFKEDELAYLSGLRYIKSDFIDFLYLFQFRRRFIEAVDDNGTLVILARGPLIHVMDFEIRVLSIVNELYFTELERRTGISGVEEGNKRLDARIEKIKAIDGQPSRRFPFEFFDFGLRRRYSGDWQRQVATRLSKEVPEHFRGTSNVLLARDLGITPIGTMAHEFLALHQAVGVRLVDFQKAALQAWVSEFRGDLGTALTDIVGMDAFLRDFDLYFAKLFDGMRHDSGDPYVWGEKALRHYHAFNIDPATKRFTFSDGLDVDSAIQLWHCFGDRIKTGFGIGTKLMNDYGPKPLNIVMKLVQCNGSPVAKLSDSPGKTLCDDETYVRYLADVFNTRVML